MGIKIDDGGYWLLACVVFGPTGPSPPACGLFSVTQSLPLSCHDHWLSPFTLHFWHLYGGVIYCIGSTDLLCMALRPSSIHPLRDLCHFRYVWSSAFLSWIWRQYSALQRCICSPCSWICQFVWSLLSFSANGGPLLVCGHLLAHCCPNLTLCYVFMVLLGAKSVSSSSKTSLKGEHIFLFFS